MDGFDGATVARDGAMYKVGARGEAFRVQPKRAPRGRPPSGAELP